MYHSFSLVFFMSCTSAVCYVAFQRASFLYFCLLHSRVIFSMRMFDHDWFMTKRYILSLGREAQWIIVVV